MKVQQRVALVDRRQHRADHPRRLHGFAHDRAMEHGAAQVLCNRLTPTLKA
jgi:hypothetical protein